MSKSYSSKPSKTCAGCGQLYFEDDSNCVCPPSFEDWKLDLTNQRLSELACCFYSEKIGILYAAVLNACGRKYAESYELAEDAEDFILEDIVLGLRFEDEFYNFLKEQYKEEKG